ncbi:UNVERIFIED_CONTAM: Kiwellin-1 [Sesamum calycinum]|uniref:Kiwellin-1 n=1 Tax=Sesamum calycinum TaxID=2727403 RepID=A0AAW2T0E8_9LAMI
MTLNLKVDAKSCKPSGKIKGKKPPKDQCNQENDSDCCEEGKYYDIYKCSPKVTAHTKAVLTINSFEKRRRWCFKNITIYGNGKNVNAMVVDECDSTKGCDADHDYQPPCDNNIVDGSKAVWEALGVPKNDRGLMDIHWTDA